MTDIRNRCVHCGSAGSYCSCASPSSKATIPYLATGGCPSEDNSYGYACHECAMKECDRCPEILALNEEVTPCDCGTEADFFRDGAFRVHYKCLTKEEKRAWLESYLGLDNGALFDSFLRNCRKPPLHWRTSCRKPL
jgi:hypothetical protein